MKIREIISEVSEKHHHLTPWQTVDHNFQMCYDTHAYANVGGRGVPAGEFYNLVAYSFRNKIVTQIPRGRSSYIHDTNTGNSIVVERVPSYPFRYIVRTAMSVNEPPGRPVISVEVPEIPDTPKSRKENLFWTAYFNSVGEKVRTHGVDAVSQDIAAGKTMIPLTREQRRKLERLRAKGKAKDGFL